MGKWMTGLIGMKYSFHRNTTSIASKFVCRKNVDENPGILNIYLLIYLPSETLSRHKNGDENPDYSIYIPAIWAGSMEVSGLGKMTAS